MMKKVGAFVLCAFFMSSMTVNASAVTASAVQESSNEVEEKDTSGSEKKSETSQQEKAKVAESSSTVSGESESGEAESSSTVSKESESKENESKENDSKESVSRESESTEAESKDAEAGSEESKEGDSEGKTGEADETGETPETDETDETDETGETDETDETAETESAEVFEIPDVVGMNYQDADAALADLPVEIIHTFQYSSEYSEDIVMSQSVSGRVAVEDAAQITLTISEGSEKARSVQKEEVISIDGDFSDWSDKPYSWEFGYDNSSEVWNGWFYVDGKAQQCETGTYNNTVRHKISLYCDEENVYVYVQLATAYGSGFNGLDYEFTVDGQKAAFLLLPNGADLSTPGVYEVDVKNRNGSAGYTLADGAASKLLVHENGKNNELEVKIPLSTLQMQNANIDIENIGSIEFLATQLMYRPVVTAGADTDPYLGAALAFLLVPSSTCILKKYSGKKKA